MIYFNFPKSVYLKYREKINKTVLKVLNSGNYVKSKELSIFEKNFAHRSESECTTDSLSKQGDKWKVHSGENLDSAEMRKRLR